MGLVSNLLSWVSLVGWLVVAAQLYLHLQSGMSEPSMDVILEKAVLLEALCIVEVLVTIQ
jgi:hypothetical protein